MFGTERAKHYIRTVWGFGAFCLLAEGTQRAVGKPAAIASTGSQPHCSEDVGDRETPLQPSQVELTQPSTASHLDEVLFHLDGSGQGLNIRGLHLQLLLLCGHHRLESSELPLQREEKRSPSETSESQHRPAGCCPISHTGGTLTRVGSKTSSEEQP